MSMLSNTKIINELNAIRDSFIKTRPKMEMNSFVSSRKTPYNLGDGSQHRLKTFLQGGGAPMNMKHPLSYGSINGNTLHPDPLYSGIVYRPVKGGAMLGDNMPLNGGNYSESDSNYSDSDYSDSDEEGGDLMSESSEGEYSSGDEGGGVYDDYIKPAGKALGSTLYNVGKTAFHDVVVPVGKELLKDAIMGALVGAGHSRVYGGVLTGTKEEFYHILKKIDPSFKLSRHHTKKQLRDEVYKHLKGHMSPTDLKTLHFLDAFASHNYNLNDPMHRSEKIQGGLNGTKKELKELLKVMYPDLDFKKMSKSEIVKHIVSHVDASKSEEATAHYAKKVAKEEARKAKHKEPEELPFTFTEFEQPTQPHTEKEEIVELVKKPRGRPKVEKPVKEKKPRGRPKVEKPVKEKKPRGRPKVDKPVKEKKEPKKRAMSTKKIAPVHHPVSQPLEELEEMFKEIEKPKQNDDDENFGIAGGKIKKLIGTRRGNRARGAIVAEVMKKHGLNLAQASKYVSQHNLY